MAFTNPATATAGSTALTAAFWNEQVRDNMLSVKTAVKNVQDKKTHKSDVTINTGGVVEVTSSLACTVAASTNDILIAGFSTIPAVGTNIAHFNLMTKVGSTLTNKLQESGTAFEPWLISASLEAMVTGSVCYKVVAGDISGGNVVVTLVCNTAAASRKVVQGLVGATVWVMNIGQAIV